MKSLLTGLVMLLLAGDASAAMRVALIFDDGPDVAQNAKLLQVLADNGVKATFAFVGRNVEAHPELARAAATAGHDICNHSFTHPHLRQLDDANVKDELTRTSQAIEKAVGRRPSFFWAPFLETDERVERLTLEATGLRHFPMSRGHLVSSSDWDARNVDAAAIYRNATTGVRDRTVILCHEWRAETVAQLPAIITELRRQGAEFLTFSELAVTLDPAPVSASSR
jgi:peptidoglycan/xylan/chitin deacetylase (PgdA/CDA1 family)